ncbi:hypothetical protein [Burkholderia ubonensis]|uniref:hypothetical protein n=1 Tax=Burkholderia ubonensis TaxID=101571 RepID=UPI0007577B2E|nr:hypothetical protein [Burkholderia ubonensis]AOI68871.1 hypothetical protein WI31_04505 [Burkholderia ubonensis]KUZ15883.1 hypothetical protein WI29_18835 [Burkholderia ubonensis]KUZ24592.1 hypothetical protein WI30_29210 [Burkholderia ubonensis]KUZ38420.1 hypothetical protein WI32_12235 [Burkholderia ubonensis]KUZ46208.1 hypothetical protein WI33_24735 [Burkholderia ubonensis]
MSTYSGLLVRINPEDVGQVPAEGLEWISPDIIPYGTQVLTYVQAVETYGQTIAQPIVNNLNNNIYVRCKNINLNESSMKGNVNLYYADSSLFLLPNTWVPLTLPTQDNAFGIDSGSSFRTTIPQKSVGLVEAPFNLKYLQPGRHFCFIAVVNNNNKKFPIPARFSSNVAFAKWVKDNPNIAQRNISLIPGSNSNYTQYASFGNNNPKPATFRFDLTASNIPPQTTWGAQCADLRLPSPFTDSGTFKQANDRVSTKWITVPPLVGKDNQLMNMAFTFSAPPGTAFSGDVNIKIEYRQIATGVNELPELYEEEQQSGLVRDYETPVIENNTVKFIIEPSIELGAIVIVPSFHG